MTSRIGRIRCDGPGYYTSELQSAMSTAATSLTFREYTDDDGNHLIIDTDYMAYAHLSTFTDKQVRKKTVHLAWADARELGTSLIAWTGTAQTWANNRFGRDNQIADVAVEDGKATITIGGIHVTLSDDDVIGLGQRLIAWAGVFVKGVGWNAISAGRAR
jgi:hypothetical protein